jgi:hypothetical protein
VGSSEGVLLPPAVLLVWCVAGVSDAPYFRGTAGRSVRGVCYLIHLLFGACCRRYIA